MSSNLFLCKCSIYAGTLSTTEKYYLQPYILCVNIDNLTENSWFFFHTILFSRFCDGRWLYSLWVWNWSIILYLNIFYSYFSFLSVSYKTTKGPRPRTVNIIYASPLQKQTSLSAIIIFAFTYFLKFLVAPVFRMSTQGFALFNLKVLWIKNYAGLVFYRLLSAITKLQLIKKNGSSTVCILLKTPYFRYFIQNPVLYPKTR